MISAFLLPILPGIFRLLVDRQTSPSPSTPWCVPAQTAQPTRHQRRPSFKQRCQITIARAFDCHGSRGRHRQQTHVGMHPPVSQNAGRDRQIIYPRIGAGTKEHLIDLPSGGFANRNAAIFAPRQDHHRLDLRQIQLDLACVNGVRVGKPA